MDDIMKAKMSLVLLSVFYTVTFASASIPALFWGNPELQKLKSYPAGHTVSSQDFTQILEKLAEKSPQDIIVFLQNKLSLEDFTHYAGVYEKGQSVFNNLKGLMKKESSSHYPRVATPGDSVDKLREKFASNRVHNLKAPYQLKDLPLQGATSNLVLVHLPDVSPDTESSLKKTDDIIGSVTSDLSSMKKPYTALYTGVKTSKVDPQALYLGRHLLAAPEAGQHLYNVSNCILFYADQLAIVASSNRTVLNVTTEFSGACTNETRMDATFRNQGNVKFLKMSLMFQKSKDGYWSLPSWKLSYQLQSQNNVTEVSLPSPHIYAPVRFSYHCQDQLLSLKDVSFQVTNLQLQAYQRKKYGFGRASDCVGFFTIPIWTGIVSTLVLVSILTFGIALLANINTMDRFDDPKGKTISVNVGE